MAWPVRGLLVAQRGPAAALARALPAEPAGAGRSCLRRRRRGWQGPALERAPISPALSRLALPLVAAGQALVALDTTRLGPWAVWLAGRVVAGRPLPLGWAVLPYPWPKGRCRTPTRALLQQRPQALPAGVGWTLGAARGVPRAALVAQGRQGGTDFRGRRRGSDAGTGAGGSALVAGHGAARRRVGGPRPAAALGGGRPAQPLGPGGLVVTAAVGLPPPHPQTPGPLRAPGKRATRPAQHRPPPQGRQPPPPSAAAPRSAQPWGLGPTAPTVAQAVTASAQRMSSEAPCRAWHSGWGGRAALGALPPAAMVARRIGVLCLPSPLEMHWGQRGSAALGGQQRRGPWPVTNRVRGFGCGPRLGDDPGSAGSGWLAQHWDNLEQRGAAPPGIPVSEPALEEAA